mmetsp:Transcript_13735/g.19064  ORF Transcript_13735/g.19064 Transcript_13735/m.19064 type:complete len:94 (+) Transcript_13735:2639-2920(+)
MSTHIDDCFGFGQQSLPERLMIEPCKKHRMEDKEIIRCISGMENGDQQTHHVERFLKRFGMEHCKETGLPLSLSHSVASHLRGNFVMRRTIDL